MPCAPAKRKETLRNRAGHTHTHTHTSSLLVFLSRSLCPVRRRKRFLRLALHELPLPDPFEARLAADGWRQELFQRASEWRLLLRNESVVGGWQTHETRGLLLVLKTSAALRDYRLDIPAPAAQTAAPAGAGGSVVEDRAPGS